MDSGWTCGPTTSGALAAQQSTSRREGWWLIFIKAHDMRISTMRHVHGGYSGTWQGRTVPCACCSTGEHGSVIMVFGGWNDIFPFGWTREDVKFAGVKHRTTSDTGQISRPLQLAGGFEIKLGGCSRQGTGWMCRGRCSFRNDPPHPANGSLRDSSWMQGDDSRHMWMRGWTW